ncbi:MAG: gluconate 2-dehydrogenase subunit 3 family protein [Gemmatimonadaceae bacterium]
MSSGIDQSRTIDRREAIKRVTVLLGGATLVGGSSLLAACAKDRTTASAGVGEFTAADVALLDEIAETMLPETTTPGAKAAQVGAFMALMVTDTYKPEDQALFRAGMKQLDDASMKASNASFMSATAAARLALLEQLDREQKARQDAKDEREKLRKQEFREGREQKTEEAEQKDEEPEHYFRMMKELALLGYFTSEIGYTKAMRYVESPGKFEPCVPYTAGETIWADHA